MSSHAATHDGSGCFSFLRIFPSCSCKVSRLTPDALLAGALELRWNMLQDGVASCRIVVLQKKKFAQVPRFFLKYLDVLGP